MNHLAVRRTATVLLLSALGVSWLTGPGFAAAGISGTKCVAGGGTVGGDGGGGKACVDGLFNGYKVI